jgi:hypothetical protein
VREVEFLPPWYPVLRRRRALAAAQSYATATLMLGLLLWGAVARQHLGQKQATAAMTTAELQQVRGDLKMLDEQLVLKRQLEQQEAILRRLGLQVDATRLLGELNVLMAAEMFVLELALDTEETTRTPTITATQLTKGAIPPPPSQETVDRKLKVRLVGVAPSDVDVANFLAGLSARTHFDQVSMTYARDRASDGRLMREFEVTFFVDLNVRSAE